MIRRFAVAWAALVTVASCGGLGGSGGDTGFVSRDAGSDCGGRTGNPCGDGAKCTERTDCQSALCSSGICIAPPSACTTGTKTGSETDIDCGGPICPACADGKQCLVATDCGSLFCHFGVCEEATAHDGVKDDSETDIDCGGARQSNGSPNPLSDHAPPCAVGKVCQLPSDCVEDICSTAPTAEPPEDGGLSDGGMGTLFEAGVDAGSPHQPGKNGKKNPTKQLDAGASAIRHCQPATDYDGVRNDSETDVDCGGALLADGQPNPKSDGAPPCAVGQACALGSDCTEGVCNANMNKGGPPINCVGGTLHCVCQEPSPTDGVENGGETDIDCGGSTTPGSDAAPPCAPGKSCKIASDCTSHVCATSGVCAPPSPTDGVQNDSETDVDCGGALLSGGSPNPASDGAPACADDQKCAIDVDCLSGFCSNLSGTCVDGQSCKGLVPAAPILDQTGVMNADGTVTTNVDANGDAVGTPDPNGVGQNAGLDTCGIGESTDPTGMQQHESCCRSLLLPGSTTLRMDKYIVTSGRIRQFLQALNYDVRDWAIAQFDASWNPITQAGQMLASQLPIAQAGVTSNTLYFLPRSNDTAEPLNAVVETGALVLDTSGVQGCYTSDGAGGAATYWWDAVTIHTMAGSPPRPFTQDYYDIKPMNCIPYFLAAAFCAWDGGRVELHAEHDLVWGSATYPWGATLIPNPYPGNQAITMDAACMPGVPNGSVNCTIDWFNGGQASGSQGNFYFYPSFINNIPNQFVPDSLSNTLDLSVYIAAPGRFYLDKTTQLSASFSGTEGWQDLGANMLEVAPGTNPITGAGAFCDESGILGPGESYNCGTNGVLRGSNLPDTGIYGGSWEGHGPTMDYAPDGWSFYRQYGKTGLRCVRPAEPAP
jgi:hypothetical protein